MNLSGLSRILVLLSIALTLSSGISAQLQIMQFPSINQQFSVRDIFNISIVNSGANVLHGILNGQILSENGKVLAELNSQIITLHRGYNQVNESIVSSCGISYNNDEVEKFELSYRSLPPGKYEVCVKLRFGAQPNEAGHFDQETHSCNTFYCQLKVPLLLTFPSDNSAIDSKLPVFNWIPIAAAGASTVRYTLKLSEVHDGQDATTALSVNPVMLMMENLEINTVAYPSTLEQLQGDQKYAWQIIAFGNSSLLATSEPAIFTVKKAINNTPPTYSYIKLLPYLTGSYTEVKTKKLCLQFNERYSSGKFECKVYDSKGNTISVKMINAADSNAANDGKTTSHGLTKNAGLNKYILNLEDSRLAPGFYVLEAINQKDEKFYLRFKLL